jgi:D-3-phosphoglycerate dehydrogenase / 2-oxoglutarate reductase
MHNVFVSWPGYSTDDPETGARLVAAGHGVILAPKLGARSEDELIDLMRDASACIVSTDPFTRRVIAANPGLRIIARVGVGTDSIDHDAAKEHGVGISITPGMNAEPVADQTLAMILALIRQVVAQDENVKSGRWERVGRLTGWELPGKRVGVVGAGTIGRAVIRRLRGFDVEIMFFDPPVAAVDGAQKMPSLDRLLETSDIVTLHLPLLAATKRLIDGDAIRQMKPGAFLINTSRGGLVDQKALFAALRSGHLGGAGLDVFEEEPPAKADLDGVPNLVCSAHMGGLSRESLRRMTASATASVLAVLRGEIPDTIINPDALRAGPRAKAS